MIKTKKLNLTKLFQNKHIKAYGHKDYRIIFSLEDGKKHISVSRQNREMKKEMLDKFIEYFGIKEVGEVAKGELIKELEIIHFYEK